MRILVTRPRDDAAPLVAALAARGHETLVAPMLEIHAPAPGAAAPDLAGVQALLFTSANGVRAFAALTPARDLPVFAVGEASGQAARAAGFARVESAGGDVDDLARLVRERAEPAAGALYHIAANRLAGDLKGALEAAGFAVRRDILYESVAARALPAELRAALTAGQLDAATFFSPRTAATFADLVARAGLAESCTRLTAICLSAAVAAALQPLRWRAVGIAAQPTQDSLLAALDRTVRGGSAADDRDGATSEMSDETSARDTVPAGDSATASAEGAGAAQSIISLFGGIRPMAHKLEVAVSTVQGWRERDSIPAARHAQIVAAAQAHGLTLDAATLAASDRSGESAPAAPVTPAAQPAAQARTEPAAKERTIARPPPAADKAQPQAATAVAGTAEPKRTPERGAAAPAEAEPARTPGPAMAPATAFLLGAAVLAGGVILAVLAREAWLPLVDEGAGSAATDPAALARVADLETRVAALESAPAPDLPPDARRRLETLTTRLDGLDGLEGRLAALASADEALRRDLAAATARLDAPQTLSPAAQEALGSLRDDLDGLGRTLGALESRLGALEGTLDSLSAERTAAAESAAGDLATVLAVMQLRDALAGSTPFATELETLWTLAAARDDLASALDALAPLAPYADSGVPGLVALKAAFPALARAVVAADQAGAGEDWLAGVRRRLSSLVTVRPLGAVAGEDAPAVVARAEALLAEDDLAGAVAELGRLSGPPAAAAADWLARARARVAAQTALVRLNAAVSARLATADG